MCMVRRLRQDIYIVWTFGCGSYLHRKLLTFFFFFLPKRLLQNFVTLSIPFQACVGFPPPPPLPLKQKSLVQMLQRRA